MPGVIRLQLPSQNDIVIAMQVVILAAGRGTRFGEMTRNCPKPLLKINGRPILAYTLDALPDTVSEIIIVVRYLGDQIREFVGHAWQGIPVKYVEQGEMQGTLGALCSARGQLTGTFLVLNADDIYDTAELAQIVSCEPIVFALKRCPAPTQKFLDIIVDEQNCIIGSVSVSSTDSDAVCNIATGAYLLDQSIFYCQPVAIDAGEYGLPHTIFAMGEHRPVQAFFMNYWLHNNSPDDLARSELLLVDR